MGLLDNFPRLGRSKEEAVPTGVMLPFAGPVAPTGYLMCDGSTVSRSTYAKLYTAIGIAHGQGDGSTTFHLPDMRGRVPRGVDSGAGRDPDAGSRTAGNSGGNAGDDVGSVQGDQMGSHSHGQSLSTNTTGNHSHTRNSAVVSGSGVGGNGGSWVTGFGTRSTTTNGNHSHSITGSISNAGGNENRMKNLNCYWIIKV